MLYSAEGMPTVYIISPDWTLRATVRAELREAGVEALGMETADDAAREIAAGRMPSAIVLDGAVSATGIERLARGVPVIVVASRTEHLQPPAGAAAVLYRPVRVGEIVARVHEILRGHAA